MAYTLIPRIRRDNCISNQLKKILFFFYFWEMKIPILYLRSKTSILLINMKNGDESEKK